MERIATGCMYTILIVIGSILLIGYEEKGYGQMTNGNFGSGNDTFSESVECFVSTCENGTGQPSLSVTDQNTTSALIGVSFNNISLKDIQQNTESLKHLITQYVNSTIDNFTSGQITTAYTFAIPDHDFPECTPKQCIVGIIFPPEWPDLN